MCQNFYTHQGRQVLRMGRLKPSFNRLISARRKTFPAAKKRLKVEDWLSEITLPAAETMLSYAPALHWVCRLLGVLSPTCRSLCEANRCRCHWADTAIPCAIANGVLLVHVFSLSHVCLSGLWVDKLNLSSTLSTIDLMRLVLCEAQTKPLCWPSLYTCHNPSAGFRSEITLYRLYNHDCPQCPNQCPKRYYCYWWVMLVLVLTSVPVKWQRTR